MLRRAMQEEGAKLGLAPNTVSEYELDSHSGLLGRLMAAQAEQSRHHPVPEDRRSAPFASRDLNFRQLSRVSNGIPPPMASSSVASTETGMAVRTTLAVAPHQWSGNRNDLKRGLRIALKLLASGQRA